MEPLKVVAYLRQSQDRTGEGLAVVRQKDDVERLIESRKWTLLAIREDNDVSAAGKRKRPGFEAVLADLESGRAKGVVAWSMDRLTRNRRDTVRLMEIGERTGATLAFVRGSDLDLSTPAGRLTADILSGVAAHEIAVKSDRQKRAVQQAAAAGKWIGGRRPFGYDADGVTIRKAEADALAQVYRDVIEGVSVAACARKINAQGLFTPQGSKWTSQTLRPTLMNCRYAGLRAAPGPGHKTPGVREPIAKAVWDGIVSEETWRAAVAILTDPSRTTRGQTPKRLLTGIARCGVDGCGAPVHGAANKLHQATYRCRANQGHISRRAEPIEEYVKEVVLAQLERPDAAELFLHRDDVDVPQLRTDRTALQARLDELAALYAEGTLTASQLRTSTRLLRNQVDAIEAKLADAGKVSALVPLLDSDDRDATWDLLDVDRRRAIVDRLLKVEILPAGRGVRTFRPESVSITLKGRERDANH